MSLVLYKKHRSIFRTMHLPLAFFLLLITLLPSFAQVQDSLHPLKNEADINKVIDMLFDISDSLQKIKIRVEHAPEDPTFKGTRIISPEETDEQGGQLLFHGYVSSYYALYSDSAPAGQYHKFPTISPLSNSISLNIAQLGARFISDKSRAALTLHYGDIPRSSWSPDFNMLQEANAGIRITPKLWFDAGFFRTHIGLESIQPRENIGTSIAVTTFYEPYYMSGAKLTYKVRPTMSIQLNAFNSYNNFVEHNRRKAIGFSGIYEPNEHFSLTFNTIWNNDIPDDSVGTQGLSYNNLYFTYRNRRWIVGFEANLGIVEKASLAHLNDGIMYSTLLAAKYALKRHFSTYGRFEYFNDPTEILTGAVYDSHHNQVGLELIGLTAGLEFKPVRSSYLRLESRFLDAVRTDDDIFVWKHQPSHFRLEGSLSFGVWF